MASRLGKVRQGQAALGRADVGAAHRGRLRRTGLLDVVGRPGSRSRGTGRDDLAVAAHACPRGRDGMVRTRR